MTLSKTFLVAGLAAAALVGFVSQSASAAVTIPLVNADFEETSPRGRWGVFEQINGWFTVSGTGIEIQKDGTARTQTPFGNQWVELDSHNRGLTDDSNTNSAMGQVVRLGAGDYTLSFFYQPRTNRNDNDNGIAASIFGWDGINGVPEGAALAELEIIDQKRRTHGGWAEYSLAFSTIAEMDYLIQFQATGRANTLGGFLDNVSLTLAAPEPATWLMMLSGFALAGLSLRRRGQVARA